MTFAGRLTVILTLAAAALVLVADSAFDAQAAQLKKQKSAPAVADPGPADKKAATKAATGDGANPKADAPPQAAATKPTDPDKPAATPADARSADAAAKAADKWSDSEIADAKARCAQILQRIHAVAIAHEPIREGVCGAPAPIELISIGQNPEVALSPPAIVRCDLAETLAGWLEKDLQPLARKHLKSEIIRIDTMSSYSCRNAYGRKSTHLSEHGLANALDIGGFVTANAKTAYVLEGWGTPQREILARIAAEKAEAEKRLVEQAAADKAGQINLASEKKPGPPAAKVDLQTASATSLGGPASGIARSSIIEGVPKLTVTLPGASRAAARGTAVSIAEPVKLGGPMPAPDKLSRQKSGAKKVAAVPVDSGGNATDPETAAFLHEAHTAACQLFGTTLGPEANADHRNHFHVDMAPRKFTKICD